MNNDFGVLLQAVLDSNSIGKSSLNEIQKVLNKYHLNLSADLNKAELLKTVKQVVPEIEKELKKITGVDIKITDDALLKSINQVIRDTEKAKKAEDSFVEAMSKGREKIEAARQAEEKRQQTAQNKAINKALEEEWKERQKNIEASKKQAEADKLAEKTEAYDAVYKSLDRLYTLKKDYAKLSTTDSREAELLKARIEEEEEILRRRKSATTETDNWDANKQRAIAEKEISLQKELQAIYEQTAKKAKTIKFSVDSGNGSSDYANRIEKLKQDFEKYGISAEEASQKTEKLKTILAGFKDSDGNWLPDEQIVAQADKIEQEFKSVKVSVDSAKLAFDKLTQPVSKEKATALINRINTFLTKNTAITQEAKNKLQGYVNELENGVDLNRWNEINGALKETENSMRGLGKLGANLRQQFKQAAESFTQWLSVSSAVMFLVTKTRQAVVELKEVDTLLTEISKANDKLTKSQLADIGDSAFETASRYGKKATDYLAGVQEMSRAGYQNAEAMGELSVKAQGAGDMTEEVANKFIVATDKAYKLNGSLTDLTKIMDGINYITNHNAINMTELSEGFSIVGSTAASFGVEANELTAALATMGASTQQSGSEVARAFRAILLNIRQVSDEEEGIDAEGLTKYEEACNALGVSLKKTVGGVQELRDPMEVLKELSEEYNKLSDTDIKKVNLLNSVGGKVYHVIQKCITRMNLIAGNPLEPCTTI